ncbi:transporter substrate-binding domain-containing protein [uncultured Kiloniella sp.]|mgnify:CR=1 FL=1|uniref:substrate-binding periplasmic protein n=1 Tax=uncultured Kiloniella sp. TaxID=1133091 RepID=UPI0026033DD5|nr:transporter substrate-binding domain-containing protein [uncultured Kiloniella sp.]
MNSNASWLNIKSGLKQALRRLCLLVGCCLAVPSLSSVSALAQSKTSSPVGEPSSEYPLTERKLVIGVSEWAPYMGYDLPDHGLVVDVLKIAMKRAGIDVEVKAIPWSRLLKETYDGKVDLIPGLWYQQDRDEKIAYGSVLAENRLVLISHKRDPRRVHTIDDLKNRYVGIAQDYAYPKAFAQATHFKRDVSKNLEIILKKLEDGRVDAALADELVARHTANLLFPGRTVFYYGTEAIDVKNLYIGISRKTRGYEAILQLIDKHLSAMKADGTYRNLLVKHGLLDLNSQ